MKSNHNFHMRYFEQEDVLHLVIPDELQADGVEIDPDVTVELNKEGELIGLEIINVRSFLPNFLFPNNSLTQR
ncbi:DUF2283 domain-containing protein [Synechocystis sp. B12]|nr:DUF2283 domain-containing protein [Synechocystis sp. B12]